MPVAIKLEDAYICVCIKIIKLAGLIDRYVTYLVILFHDFGEGQNIQEAVPSIHIQRIRGKYHNS